MRDRRSAWGRVFDAIPWWWVVLCGAALWLAWNVAHDASQREIFDVLAQGLSVTAFVTLASFGLAVLLGLGVAVAALSRWTLLRELARLYCEVLRGVPSLVLLFYMAFVAAPAVVALANAALAWPREHGWVEEIQVRDFSLTWRAIAALALSYSAFIAEVFRAGLQAVDRGQIEAARALGLSRWNVFRYVSFPLAFRVILPPLGNDFVALVKDSALVSVLGVGDITQQAKVYASGSFRFFDTYNLLAALYLTMTVSLSLALRALEGRLRAHERR
jgi:polar amino acid transport system permease protein